MPCCQMMIQQLICVKGSGVQGHQATWLGQRKHFVERQPSWNWVGVADYFRCLNEKRQSCMTQIGKSISFLSTFVYYSTMSMTWGNNWHHLKIANAVNWVFKSEQSYSLLAYDIASHWTTQKNNVVDKWRHNSCHLSRYTRAVLYCLIVYMTYYHGKFRWLKWEAW